jgi:hypothetical protein
MEADYNYIKREIARRDRATSPVHDLPSSKELAKLAQIGGAFDWLADEPDLYSLDDGEPV